MSRSFGLGVLIAASSMIGSGEVSADISFDVPQAPGQPPLSTYSKSISNNGSYAVGYTVNPVNSALAGFERLASGAIIAPITATGDNNDYTRAMGVNNAGTVVGDFLNTTGGTSTFHGFILSNGTFAQFDVGGPVSTSIFGINDAGSLVGTFGSSAQPNEGFVRIGGALTTFNIAGAASVFGLGINDNNQAVGQYTDAMGVTHAYIRAANGAITTFDGDAGATFTTASGINDAGMIVGYYTDATGSHGYVRGATGAIATFSVFGSSATDPLGINDLGQVTGAYTDSSGLTHGFISSPLVVPEPSSLALAGLGLGVTASYLRMGRRRPRPGPGAP